MSNENEKANIFGLKIEGKTTALTLGFVAIVAMLIFALFPRVQASLVCIFTDGGECSTFRGSKVDGDGGVTPTPNTGPENPTTTHGPKPSEPTQPNTESGSEGQGDGSGAVIPLEEPQKPPKLAKDFFIQIFSDKSDAFALNYLNEFREKYPAVASQYVWQIRAKSINGSTYYRVQTGGFESEETAKDQCAKIKKATEFDCVVSVP
ncbi:Sporulation related domain protein [Roseibium album]|nr:Sporulation related domain protein [Roseibium album]